MGASQKYPVDHLIEYIVFIVKNFATEFNISGTDAFNYLNKYKGIDFLENHYGFEHTQNPHLTVKTLTNICYKNGGNL
jgi:hypothetical protein